MLGLRTDLAAYVSFLTTLYRIILMSSFLLSGLFAYTTMARELLGYLWRDYLTTSFSRSWDSDYLVLDAEAKLDKGKLACIVVLVSLSARNRYLRISIASSKDQQLDIGNTISCWWKTANMMALHNNFTVTLSAYNTFFDPTMKPQVSSLSIILE